MKKPSGAGLLALFALTVTGLAGCASMAPEYVRPEAPIPEVYSTEAYFGKNSKAVDRLRWREYFTDPVLIQLIETALDNNRDLQTALLRVEEARASYGIQRSGRLPDISLGAQGARSRIPADLTPAGRTLVGSEYRAEVGLTAWELDLWGRVRSLEQSALESWLATEAAAHAAHTALVSEVAHAYLALREVEQRLAVTRETVASREKSYVIFQRRYEAGATAKLEVTQVQTLLTQAQVLLAQLELEQETRRNALRVMAGDKAVSLVKQESGSIPVLTTLQAGLPSDLLVNRPDIIAAEHQLRAANANIGAARAAFFHALR